jgi:hypothetical protein
MRRISMLWVRFDVRFCFVRGRWRSRRQSVANKALCEFSYDSGEKG